MKEECAFGKVLEERVSNIESLLKDRNQALDTTIRQVFSKVEEYRVNSEVTREEVMKEIHSLERRVTGELMTRLPIWVTLALSGLAGACGIMFGLLYEHVIK